MKLHLLTCLFAIATLQAVAQIGLPPASQNAKGGQTVKGKANGYSAEQLDQKARETLDRKNQAAERSTSKSPQTRIPTKGESAKSSRQRPTNLGEHPKLVVGITVDQMRMDYLYRYWDDFECHPR